MTLADEIRALKLTGHSPMPVFDSTWNAALDRAAALAEAHESALVAQLQDPVAVHANMLRGTIAKPTWEQIKHLYHADAQAALDRIKAEAHRAGMREAAGMLAPAGNAKGGLWAKRLENRRIAILAAAEKEDGK